MDTIICHDNVTAKRPLLLFPVVDNTRALACWECLRCDGFDYGLHHVPTVSRYLGVDSGLLDRLCAAVLPPVSGGDCAAVVRVAVAAVALSPLEDLCLQRADIAERLAAEVSLLALHVFGGEAAGPLLAVRRNGVRAVCVCAGAIERLENCDECLGVEIHDVVGHCVCEVLVSHGLHEAAVIRNVVVHVLLGDAMHLFSVVEDALQALEAALVRACLPQIALQVGDREFRLSNSVSW